MGGVCDNPAVACGRKERSGMDTVPAICGKEAKFVEGEFCVEKAGDEYVGETQAEEQAGGDAAKEDPCDWGVRGVATKGCGGRVKDCRSC
jgi:hypothetical protein